MGEHYNWMSDKITNDFDSQKDGKLNIFLIVIILFDNWLSLHFNESLPPIPLPGV